LSKREPGVVVDGDVEVVVADRVAAHLAGVTHLAAAHLPPAAVADPAELFHVEVEELAGTVALVTHDGA